MVSSRRQNRFEAEYPNQVHQLAHSVSQHFFPVKCIKNDWILNLKLYDQVKPETNSCLMVYALVDDYSRYRLSRYEVERGNSPFGGISFLEWAWSRNLDHDPFRGLPKFLFMSRDLAKDLIFQEFCERLKVEIITRGPNKPQITGKVANNFRTQWKRFETLFFYVNPNWRNFEISLTELNQELSSFWRKRNQEPHRGANISKEGAWSTIIDKGNLIEVDHEAWGTLFHRYSRKVDAAGCFSFKGSIYQVKEIYACDVWVYTGIVKGKLIVQDKRDDKRYEPIPFEPKKWSDYL